MGVFKEMQRRNEVSEGLDRHVGYLSEGDVWGQGGGLALHLETGRRESVCVGCAGFRCGDEGVEKGYTVQVEPGKEDKEEREEEEKGVSELDKVVVPLESNWNE